MKSFIGERLISITEPWDGDCEGDEMILEFESGSIRISACDHSEPGAGGCPSIYLEEA